MALWDIKIARGKKADIPQLSLGELGYVTDEEEIYIGGVNGENINITNNAQLNENAQEIENIKKIVSTTFSVSEGYTATLNVIKQDHLGRSIVDGIIKKTDGTTFATSDAIQIGALPSGFTPSTVLNQPIRSFRGNVNESSDSTMIAVSNNGALVISNIVTNTVEVQFHLVFDTK